MSSGVAGLKAHQTALDVIGNNIANVNTAGFKSSSTMFRDVLYQTLTAASAGSSVTDGGTTTQVTGGLNPAQVGYGSTAASVTVNTGRAAMNTTGLSNDIYINGEGYFVVKDGDSYKYTRVAELTFDPDGYLTDGYGGLVCGISNPDPELDDPTDPDATFAIPATLDADGDGTVDSADWGPIHYTLPNGTTAPDNTFKDISFASDGTITATNAANEVVTIGRLALAHFTNPGGLSQEGNSYYKATANSGDATYAKPSDKGTGSLVAGALEASNVDLANEFSNMITTERGYQANSKIITVADTMLETLVNMVR